MSSEAADKAFDVCLCLLATVIVAGLVALCFLIGLTTHQSHVRDLEYAHQEMTACIQSTRPAADCRLIVYGSR